MITRILLGSNNIPHLKMMRLLFLCLLLLPTATAASEDNEGSAYTDSDDEDINEITTVITKNDIGLIDKAKGVEETTDQFTLIVIVVAVTVLALSVATIVTIMLVRHRMHNRQQGIYSVPTEQDQKVSV